MRKLVVYEHISIDGVIQSPGASQEDAQDFAHGGWIRPYGDAVSGAALRSQMNKPFDLLLGRRTFEIWEPFWPQHAGDWPGVMKATKYVASNSRTSSAWGPSVFLGGDVAAKVDAIKRQPGPELHVWGSSQLLRTLIKHDLVDVFWLMIYPVTLGVGKRLFAEGGIPAAFKVIESHVCPKGIIIAGYERAGALNTGA